MNWITFFLFGVVLLGNAGPGAAQLLPQSLRLADEPLAYNHAVGPAAESAQLLTFYQTQFIGGRSDLSNNGALHLHSRPFGRNAGWTVGGTLIRDRISTLSQSVVRLNTAAKIIDRGGFQWNLGVFGGIFLARSNYDPAQIAEAGDPVLARTLNLNELDAGAATYFKYENEKVMIDGGASVAQLPGNYASRSYRRGPDRNAHFDGHLAALFPVGNCLEVGPALAGHFAPAQFPSRNIDQPVFFLSPSAGFFEVAMRARVPRYDGGAYVGYRLRASAWKAGFDIALFSLNESRQGLSLAAHIAFPRGMASAGLGPQFETGLRWSWR